MWRWQKIAVLASCPLALLLGTRSASAAGFSDLPPVLGNVLEKSAVLVDGVLGIFVTGGSLTDPVGKELAGALAQTTVNFVGFLAQLVKLF